MDLGSEHERYLAEEVYKGPVILYNYPKDIKAFYMRMNDDGKTVAAMDILVPKVLASCPHPCGVCSACRLPGRLALSRWASLLAAPSVRSVWKPLRSASAAWAWMCSPTAGA
jgi:hypothetical protein